MAIFTQSKLEHTPPWTRQFADICLRALLRVHLDYLDWSASQHFGRESVGSPLLTGPGLALADELTVCAAITREFMTSRTVFGAWVDAQPGVAGGQRYFRINREVKYPPNAHSSKESVDMVVERLDASQGAASPSPWRPVYIEAKRAYCRTTKLRDGEPIVSSSQRSKIKEDIDALRRIGNRLPITTVTPRGYILVWNVTGSSPKNSNATPAQYFKTFDQNVLVWQTRFAPLCAEVGLAAAADTPTKVARWLWLVLAEVTDRSPNDIQG